MTTTTAHTTTQPKPAKFKMPVILTMTCTIRGEKHTFRLLQTRTGKLVLRCERNSTMWDGSSVAEFHAWLDGVTWMQDLVVTPA